MAQSKEPKKIYDIAKLTTKLKHWKIRVKFKLSLTPTEKKKEFKNLNKSGRHCAYILEDESGQIRLFAFDDIATRLESYDIQMDDGQEYFIWGAEIKVADKGFYSYGHKYQLKFLKSAGIRPVEGELSMKENGATSSATASTSHIAKTTGAEDTKKIKLAFDPVPLEEVENYKSEPHFDVLGIIKECSVPEHKQQETSQFFVKNMRLIDTTGEVNISVSAKKKIELKKLTELKDKVIGLVGCEWKEYGKDVICAKLKNLIEEKELPQSSLAKARKLKEFDEQRPKPSRRKETGKKNLDQLQCADIKAEPSESGTQIKKETSAPEKSPKGATGATGPAKPVTTRLACTHPFSKGTHKQKDVMSSEVKTNVSRSVGLIHIDGDPEGTGFRVGEKYIVTCVHVIKSVINVFPNFIDCERITIEFERKKYNKKEDPLQIFNFVPTIAYLDIAVDFAVLELVCHHAGVPFPPALTFFGDVCDMEIHFVGHPGCRQMKEDSDVIPRWSPNHDNEIIPYIKELAEWSKSYFPKVNGEVVDYYSILLEPPRKILFHTSFDLGSSGSPGVIIRDDMPCVVVMLSGGTPSCYYQGLFPDHPVEDCKKVEYGYAMSNIYERMRDSGNRDILNLAEKIFEKWIC
eukprot:XP_011453937.1 PREDICTED: uncharacterized protein LOC105346885 [Crassostrea gigas]